MIYAAKCQFTSYLLMVKKPGPGIQKSLKITTKIWIIDPPWASHNQTQPIHKMHQKSHFLSNPADRQTDIQTEKRANHLKQSRKILFYCSEGVEGEEMGKSTRPGLGSVVNSPAKLGRNPVRKPVLVHFGPVRSNRIFNILTFNVYRNKPELPDHVNFGGVLTPKTSPIVTALLSHDLLLRRR